ncbi:MAG: hypothetical protein ABI831_21410 [Betaproteobacteria bacterium]
MSTAAASLGTVEAKCLADDICSHGSADRLEGMAAFVEKRLLRFTGVR